MKTFFKIFTLLIFCISCENNKAIQSSLNYDIVPVPKEITSNPNGKGLTFQNKIHFSIANSTILIALSTPAQNPRGAARKRVNSGLSMIIIRWFGYLLHIGKLFEII